MEGGFIMIKKILIANRGEIVNRVIRTCEKMGISTVVVYSDADKDMPYVSEADEAYNIGASAPVKSYLNIENLVKAIKDSGADAVHPGYGFLSESASFANAVADAGAKWLGPSPEILTNIESKCYCRVIADRLNIPCTPGTIKPISSVDEIYETAERVGLPILLKLDKGGGGKGIQKIDHFENKEITETIYESMKRIGKMAFASEDVYIEKAVENPRHIEVQFLADNFGNVVCLGERECSIQRRYQKIIEESPSAVVSEEDRARLYKYTTDLIREMKYTGVGTVEYLRNGNGDFYFMEINARLQVEHPVSEYVTGKDLVEWQIRVANNEKLPFSQEDITLNGHAMECRIYSENPKTFMPMLGTIEKVDFPDPQNGNVRVEHALKDGFKISPFYDSMICKLIVWGEDRNTCISNMLSALKEFKITGVTTTINTDIAIMRNRRFCEGNYDTSFLNTERMNIGLENYVVTISRQFGSMGRPIAKRLAKLLGIAYYDRDIVDEVAKKTGISSEIIEGAGISDLNPYEKMMYPLGKCSESDQDKIFEAQSKIIRDLADKESCVIVGRCADYVLRDYPNHFSIYIYTSDEIRKENCIKYFHMNDEEATEMMKKIDEARASYNLHYAKAYSDDVTCKDLLIDSGSFSDFDITAQTLAMIVKNKFNLV